MLTRRELGEGGRRFWEDVGEVFKTSNDDFDRLHGAGREFCAQRVFEEDEDDESNEVQRNTKVQIINRKRQKHREQKNIDPVVDLTEVVSKLVANEDATIKMNLVEVKTAAAWLNREKLQRDVAVENLDAIDYICARRRQSLAILIPRYMSLP
ncbi:hypothetical protein PHMEG_00013683 [Phytophthora megakarya]|uniref:Uncharacterized protein n=1 Tax=Phytophthora megakarya TaxID=4795 RepID=A0A225W7S9_9STRA|nr:hypothetical protein PHMEG_00013683 [Phytophthora megakarya]